MKPALRPPQRIAPSRSGITIVTLPDDNPGGSTIYQSGVNGPPTGRARIVPNVIDFLGFRVDRPLRGSGQDLRRMTI